MKDPVFAAFEYKKESTNNNSQDKGRLFENKSEVNTI